MKKRIGDIITFLVVALGAVLASRALGSDGAAVAAGGASIFDSLSQHPAFTGGAGWFVFEVLCQRTPTKRAISTLYVVEVASGVLIIFFTALQRTARAVRDNDRFQKVKPEPALAPATNPPPSAMTAALTPPPEEKP
jgi:hypothetical protein